MPTITEVSKMLDNLDIEDYKAVVNYIIYLNETKESRKMQRIKENSAILEEIGEFFKEESGWESEEAMIRDMAEFRRERQV